MPDLRAAIYARFSSDKQSVRSIDDQVALCRAYCAAQGLTTVHVYEDRAVSGASTVNRFGWLKLMRDASAGKFEVVVAEALDRISRDQEDLAGIYKRLRFKQIEIRTVQDGKAEEIHVGIKGLVGALYLKDLAQKTRRGQAGVVRDGRHNGGRSYGYRAVAGQAGRLEVLDHEALVVRRIFESYLAGQSPRHIAATLNWGCRSRSAHRHVECVHDCRQQEARERHSTKRIVCRPHSLESAELHKRPGNWATRQPTKSEIRVDDS